MQRISKFTWALRIFATAHLLVVLAQAMLAGLFVTGDVNMLEVHSINAGVLGVLAIGQLVAAILIWRPGGGPPNAMRTAAGLLVVDFAEMGLGMARMVALHMPLGVLIFGGALMLTVWAWRFQPQGEMRAVAA